MPVKVKICGITRPEDALAAVEFGADMIGLNFYPLSPRHIDFNTARELSSLVKGKVKLVGVFVNAPRDLILRLRNELELDLLQFHGDEDESALKGWDVPVIKAWRIRSGASISWQDRPKADYVLLDSYDERFFGGTGRALDSLEFLRGVDLDTTIISGGLKPDTVARAAALRPWAVDVASGVEKSPGVKDHIKMRDFIANAKAS